MRVRINILFIAITLLSGCGIIPSGSNVPEGISKKYYQVFIESYELYEERVQRYKNQFVEADGELVDLDKETDPLIKSGIWSLYYNHAKRIENGEEGILTEKEDELLGDFLELYFIKQIDYFTEDIKRISLETNPEYANPVQASIDLEEKIINTLELEKTSITASLQKEDRVKTTDNQDTNTDSEKYKAYEAAKNNIITFFSQGNSEAIKHESYEKSYIAKREDGVYYITSIFEVHSSSSLSSYNYDMLLDGNYQILDAYIPGSLGIFDRPMVYDQLGQSAITNIREKMEEEEKMETFADHNRNKTSNQSTSLVYRNEEYGFTLTFPESWAGKYTITENNWYDGAEASITFDFVHEGEFISNIFSFLVFQESQFFGNHDQGPNIYVNANGGKVYAYHPAAEPPLDLLQSDEKKPLLDELMMMVNEDIPIIMDSILFD